MSVQRDSCEELAEPLSILYGVPVEIGSYFALCYLYERLSEEQQQEMCHSLEIEQPAHWYLESLAAQFRRNEITGIWLCEKDIWLFTQMAMEGMENYPRESLLSWRQVEDFYRRFLM